MKVIPLGLQTSTTTIYDQTKTTLQGRIGLRTVTDGNGSKQVLGITPVLEASVFDDTGAAPAGIHASTANNRIFICRGFATNVLTVSYYLVTTTNGNTTVAWQGDLKFTLGAAAVTYTIKGLYVDDSNPASMKFIFVATHTTVTNGGLFVSFGVNVTDFVKVSVATFPVATLASQSKVVYQYGDNAAQASQTLTVADGVGVDTTGNFAYVLNGAAATPSIFKFDIAAAPSVAPAANGYDSTKFSLKTGTLAALTGVIQLSNNVQVITPQHTSNSGSLCLSWITTTNIYLAKLSDITSAVTTLPSLQTSNVNLSSDYVASGTVSLGQYFSAIDKWILMTANGNMVAKQCVNNDPNGKYFGQNTQIKGEIGSTINIYDFGLGTGVALTDCNGFAALTSSLTGQRSLYLMDVQCDESNSNPSTGQKYCSIISPVLTGLNITQGYFLSIYKQFAKKSVYPTIQYRTSNFSTGPGAGFDATWTQAPRDGDLSALVNATSVQFRILFTAMGFNNTNTSQIGEAHLIYTDNTQSSENWVGATDTTSLGGASPFRVSFRLQKAYTTSVPKIFVRGVDDSGNAVVFDTVTNIANFDYTTNNGTSYTPLGTVPNVALTTELRFTWTSPDGLRRRWSASES